LGRLELHQQAGNSPPPAWLNPVEFDRCTTYYGGKNFNYTGPRLVTIGGDCGENQKAGYNSEALKKHRKNRKDVETLMLLVFQRLFAFYMLDIRI